ncbi:MAG: hypothetical protein KDA96_08270, partial [Planctomycetaceae bacterium]|nr:hypothetical protein [Planctomycetaceae bacterium]
TAWSIAQRRPGAVMWNGVLTALVATAFGIALWYDEVREPVRTFFGTFQTEFRSTAWILMGTGSLIVTFAGHRAGRFNRQCTKPLT